MTYPYGRGSSDPRLPMNRPDTEQFDRVVQKIDDAEQALGQMYYLVIGHTPKWSKSFGHQDALDEVKDAIAVLKARR